MKYIQLKKKIQGAVQEDPEKGIYRMRRDVFMDEDLFELEMKHIFEGNWVYVAHESQIPNPNDFSPPISAASRSSLLATRMVSSTPSSTHAPIVVPRCAAPRRATREFIPVPSMAGRSIRTAIS